MILVEIGITKLVSRFSAITAFVFCYTVSIKQQATFWLNNFGVPREIVEEGVRVLAVYLNSDTRMLEVNSQDECAATLETWFFDFSQQKLYINFGPDYNPLIDTVDYQYAIGFCNVKPVYVDAVSYLPVLESAPTIKQKQDIVGGNKLAMTTGNFGLLNKSRDLNFLKALTLFSNDARVFFLDEDERDEYERAELMALAQMLIEDVNISLKNGSVTLQDLRKSFDIKMPNVLFDSTTYPDADDDLYEKPIPLCYGPCRSIPAVCTNENVTTGEVTYRAALEMSDLGTVQVSIDDVWTTVTPTASDVSRGIFTLSEANGRGSSGEDARACRLMECNGKAISKLSDVIVDLDVKANGVVFNDTFYDTTEWAAESATIVSGGVFIKEQKSLLDLIKAIQDGANQRFRFEIAGDGRRTMRLDNNARASIMFITKEKIVENQTFEIETDRSSVFAYAQVQYNTDYNSDKYATVIDSSKEEAVARNLRQRPTVEYETYLRTSEHAAARAAIEAAMLGEVWRYMEVTLLGKEYLALRIFDMIDVEIFTDEDEWMGVWKCKVISTEPKDRKNKVRLQLIERIPFEDEDKLIRITSDGSIRIATKDATDYWRECNG